MVPYKNPKFLRRRWSTHSVGLISINSKVNNNEEKKIM